MSGRIGPLNFLVMYNFMKDTGVFTDPEWDDFECVLRKFNYYDKYENKVIFNFSNYN